MNCRKTRGSTANSHLNIAKLALLLFALSSITIVFPATTHRIRADSPDWKQEFFASPQLENTFSDDIDTSGFAPFTSSAESGPIVGPNIQVNTPQVFSPTTTLLGRSETTIAAGTDGIDLVAGWNTANGFLRAPFTVPQTAPGNPGLSGFAFSSDGGNTWTDGDTPTLFPASTSFFSGNVVTRGDPWLAVGTENGLDIFYYANLAVFQQRDSNNQIVDAGVSVHRGTFTGSSFAWNDLHLLTATNAPFDFYDKEAIAARSAFVVVSVTNFIGISAAGTNPATCQVAGGFGQIEVWRSTDGGNTFQGPVIAGPDQTDISTDLNCFTGILNQGSMPAIGKAGNVYVAWTRGPSFAGGATVTPVTSQIVGAFSGNFGKTFSAPMVIRNIVPGRQNPPVGFNRARYNDFPRIAISRSDGRIYAVFQDASVAGNGGIGGSGTICLPASGNPSPGPPCPAGQRRVMVGGGADTDIYLSFSDNNGATWSTPTLINPAAGDGRIQFWPVVSIGRNGEVNVVYYESQEIHSNTANPLAIECSIGIGGGLTRRSLLHSMVDTFFAQSLDRGLTFRPPVKVSSTSSNWCKGTVNIRPNFGDYIGATTVGPSTFAVWADDRNTILIAGNARNVVDVFYASIHSSIS